MAGGGDADMCVSAGARRHAPVRRRTGGAQAARAHASASRVASAGARAVALCACGRRNHGQRAGGERCRAGGACAREDGGSGAQAGRRTGWPRAGPEHG